MADWIDNLFKALNDQQRAANVARAERVADEDYVKAEAPAYFDLVRKHVADLVDKLNAKLGESLGGVSMRPPEYQGIRVENGGGPVQRTASIVMGLNLSTRTIDVVIQRKGQGYMSANPEKKYRFRLLRDSSEPDRLSAKTIDDPVSQIAYGSAEEFASAMLEKTFTKELLS